MAREIAHNHHERFNGSGYPRGIRKTEIPLSTRIVAIADIYDALRQKRVYQPAFTHAEAFDIITKGDGRVDPVHFDPDVLNAFIADHNKLATIFDSYQNYVSEN